MTTLTIKELQKMYVKSVFYKCEIDNDVAIADSINEYVDGKLTYMERSLCEDMSMGCTYFVKECLKLNILISKTTKPDTHKAMLTKYIEKWNNEVEQRTNDIIAKENEAEELWIANGRPHDEIPTHVLDEWEYEDRLVDEAQQNMINRL